MYCIGFCCRPRRSSAAVIPVTPVDRLALPAPTPGPGDYSPSPPSWAPSAASRAAAHRTAPARRSSGPTGRPVFQPGPVASVGFHSSNVRLAPKTQSRLGFGHVNRWAKRSPTPATWGPGTFNASAPPRRARRAVKFSSTARRLPWEAGAARSSQAPAPGPADYPRAAFSSFRQFDAPKLQQQRRRTSVPPTTAAAAALPAKHRGPARPVSASVVRSPSRRKAW